MPTQGFFRAQCPFIIGVYKNGFYLPMTQRLKTNLLVAISTIGLLALFVIILPAPSPHTVVERPTPPAPKTNTKPQRPSFSLNKNTPRILPEPSVRSRDKPKPKLVGTGSPEIESKAADITNALQNLSNQHDFSAYANGQKRLDAKTAQQIVSELREQAATR